MNRKAFFLVVLVFLLGATTGAIGYYVANQSIIAQSRAQEHPKSRRQQAIERITTEVGLTAEQQQKLAVILDESSRKQKATYDTIRPQVDALRETIRPQMDAIRLEGRQNIRGILAPEQLPRFEDLLQRLDQERKANQNQKQ